MSLPISHAIIPQAFLQNRAVAERGADQQHHHNAVSVSVCDWRSLEGGQESIRARSAAAAMSLPSFLKKLIEKKDRIFGDWWSGGGDHGGYSSYSEKGEAAGSKFQSPDASKVSFTVRDVTVKNSSLLPKEILMEASIRSG